MQTDMRVRTTKDDTNAATSFFGLVAIMVGMEAALPIYSRPKTRYDTL